MLPWLVYLVAPALVATHLALVVRRAGSLRLWRDTAVLTIVAGAFAIAMPRIYYQPFAGTRTWPFVPVAVLCAAAVVQLLAHRRIPIFVRAIPSAVAASLVLMAGSFIT